MSDPREHSHPIAWVTGAGGLIGSALMRLARSCAPTFQVKGITRSTVDLLDYREVEKLYATDQPALIIHCAVFKSTLCASQPELARQANTAMPIFLSELASASHFVFFSSDLVFDGLHGNYSEDDRPNPVAIYGETKAEAEDAIRKNPRHSILRTSLNGGVSPTGDRGFNEETRRAFEAGKTLTLFTDEFRSPIGAEVTGRALWEWIATGSRGMIHIAGTERLSRWEIGQILAARYSSLNPKIEPGSLRDFKGPTRAPDTSLNCSKAERAIGHKLPGFREWLRDQPSESF